MDKLAYQKVVSDENYPVIFGLNHLAHGDTLFVISVLGGRHQSHIAFNEFSGIKDYKSWRFVPLTNTCYWWDELSDRDKDLIERHLQSKYKIKMPIEYRRIGNWQENGVHAVISRISSHDKDFAMSSEIPSFKQWWDYHYKREGD